MITPPRHSTTARLAVIVGGCLLAAGCANGTTTDAPPSTETATPSASAPSTAPSPSAREATPSSTPSEGAVDPGAPLAETINIVLGEDGQVAPNGKKMTVAKDTLVTLRVRATHEDEIHVHGYDVEEKIPKGETVTVSFKADKSGSFEVETHHPAKTVVILNVR